MSRLRAELRDPWGPLVAAVVGGLAWAVGVPVIAAAGIGAVVYGVKAGLGSVLGDLSAPELPAARRPHPDSTAALWLRRAESALRSLAEMAAQGTGHALDLSAQEAAHEATEVLASMRRLGTQVVTISEALGRIDAPDLEAWEARLQQESQSAPSDVNASSSAQAVTERLAVRNRLRDARRELEGRLQSSALGLEGVVARVAEVQATAPSVGSIDTSADTLRELSTELEGLRLGLADAERAATRAMEGPA